MPSDISKIALGLRGTKVASVKIKLFPSRYLEIKPTFARLLEWHKKLTLTDHPKSIALKANFAQFDPHMAETAKSDKHQSERRSIVSKQGKYLLF